MQWSGSPGLVSKRGGVINKVVVVLMIILRKIGGRGALAYDLSDDACRAFVSTCPLVHKHVKMSVDEWIMGTTCPHKHVQIPENLLFCLTLLGRIISHLYFI